MHTHTDKCDWEAPRRDGKRRCRTARLERERAAHAAGTHDRRGYKIQVDGFEPEYGPIPKRVPHTRWYDEVIVLRLLAGQKTGRPPGPLEWIEFFARNKSTTFQQVRNATGLTSEGLRSRSNKHGYRWPVDLTGVGKMGKASV